MHGAACCRRSGLQHRPQRYAVCRRGGLPTKDAANWLGMLWSRLVFEAFHNQQRLAVEGRVPVPQASYWAMRDTAAAPGRAGCAATPGASCPSHEAQLWRSRGKEEGTFKAPKRALSTSWSRRPRWPDHPWSNVLWKSERSMDALSPVLTWLR